LNIKGRTKRIMKSTASIGTSVFMVDIPYATFNQIEMKK
jgi:hypothetical protein